MNKRTTLGLLPVMLCTALLFIIPPLSAHPGDPASKEIISTTSTDAKAQIPFSMSLVEEGKVKMGLSADKVIEMAGGQKNLFDFLSRAIPEHTVTVEAFYCDLYEVTNAQWVTYLEQTGQEPSPELKEFVWKNQDTCPATELSLPVRCVSYREATRFVRWCGKRIPTEKEWMRAAAGDDGRVYSWGDDWNRGKNCTNKRNTLAPVGSYEDGRSAFGMYDMTGSVWEWTSTKFEAFKGYKPPKMKLGKKKIPAEPAFNAQEYIIKGGNYLAGHVGNQLIIREPSMPVNRLDTLGFRCVKDVEPGVTIYLAAMEDLEGSGISEYECDTRDMYAYEITHLSDSEPKVITGYDCMLVAPVMKANTTTAKIIKESPEKPQPFGLLYVNHALEEPNLPPGSYTLAYRHAGLTKKEKLNKAARDEEAKKLKEAQEAEAARKKAIAEGTEKPKTQEEIEREKEEARKREQEKAWAEEKKRRDEEAKRALERIGAVTSAKEHVPFPRNKNLVVFLNANDTIVGYVEVEGVSEDAGKVPTRVVHSPASGMSDIEMGMRVLPSKVARFNFSIKVRENPF
jgi:formylglycine-generating enzyme required for sulfatase activity